VPKKSPITIIITSVVIAILGGIFFLYRLQAVTVSFLVLIFLMFFVEASVMIILWAVLIEVCLKRIAQELHIIKNVQSPPLSVQ
jgi:hypothetical protein